MCSAYLTENTDADARICITSEDVDAERQRLLRKKDREEQPEESTPQALERLVLLRKIAELLPRYDRVLFHCSCLAIDGNGVLFTAKSGTGKSTHSRLWREVFGDRVVMINDDKPFLIIGTDGASVCGTPWRGKHALGCNMSAPVKAICILQRAEENRMEPVTSRDALAVLLQQTYSPDDPEALMRTLALVQTLSKCVPVYRLSCNMDPDAAKVAFAAVHQEEKE